MTMMMIKKVYYNEEFQKAEQIQFNIMKEVMPLRKIYFYF